MSFTGGKLKFKGGDALGVKKKKKQKKTDADASAIVLAADASGDGGQVASSSLARRCLLTACIWT